MMLADPTRAGPATPPGMPQARAGDRVVCRGGILVGRIMKFVLASDGSNEHFAIVNLGSVSRIGDDCRPVPMSELKPDSTPGCWRLEREADHVRSAPIHVRDATACDEIWWSRVQRHYFARSLAEPSAGRASDPDRAKSAH